MSVLAKHWRILARTSAVIFALALLYFGWLSTKITLHYFDSFQDLNSAKAFVGFNSYYDYTRPPLLQIMLTPLMFIYRISGAGFWLERAPYFFMLIVNAIAIWSVWRLLRVGLGREIALIMVVLLLLNRAVFHYMPFVVGDLFAMGLVAAMAVSCYQLVCSEQNHHTVLTGLWLGLAMSAKQQLWPLCLAPTIFLLSEWVVRDEGSIRLRPQSKQLRWLALIALSSAAVFLLLHQLPLWLVPEYRHEPLFSHIYSLIFLRGYATGFGATIDLSASAAFTIELLARLLSIPLLLAAVVGAVLAIRSRDRLARLLLIITALYILVTTLLLPHRELRYFFYIYPALYYFIGFALNSTLDFLPILRKKLSAKWPLRFAGAGVALLMVFSVIRGTAREMESFTEDCYHNDVLIRLGHYVKEHTEAENRAIWIGDLFNIRPRNSDIIEKNEFGTEFYYLFQANANAIAYYSDRMAYDLYPYISLQDFSLQKFHGGLQRGDLIALNAEGRYPEQISIHAFEESRHSECEKKGAGVTVCVEPNKQARLFFTQVDGGLELQGESPPFLIWEIAVRNRGNVFMHGIPIIQLPYLLKSHTLKAEEVDALETIPLSPPQTLFY